MDDLLSQLGVALLLILLGLPLLGWFALRFPSTTGVLGLVTVMVELLRVLGTSAEPVCPSSGTSAPPSYAAPSGDSSQGDGTGLLGPEVQL